MKLYIAVLDEFPDYMTPTLVAHSMLGAHLFFSELDCTSHYDLWLRESFKKCVIRVNPKEFSKIALLPFTYIGRENNTLLGRDSCAVALPVEDKDIPNVLKFAKLWKPKEVNV